MYDLAFFLLLPIESSFFDSTDQIYTYICMYVYTVNILVT